MRQLERQVSAYLNDVKALFDSLFDSFEEALSSWRNSGQPGAAPGHSTGEFKNVLLSASAVFETLSMYSRLSAKVA